MSKHWVKIIHIAKAKTGLDDEAYRTLLWGAAGVDSASQIRTSQQYNAVMAGFANLGFKVQKRKVESQSTRPANMITARQEYYIRGLWELASRAKDERSLRGICKRITGVDDLSFCPKSKASALILTLRDIAKKAGYDPDTRS
jgi:hypothetical protein